ncbi:MAG: hypothetical protein ACKN9T_14375, partial [Candidatus Methylumidiphilus sp.]
MGTISPTGQVEIVTVKREACAVDEDGWLGGLQRLGRDFRSIKESPRPSTAWDQVRKELLPVIA